MINLYLLFFIQFNQINTTNPYKFNDKSLDISLTSTHLQGNLFPKPLLKIVPIKITSGMNHSCCLQSDLTILCWGANYYGQLDIPSNLPAYQQKFSSVAAGHDHNCLLAGHLSYQTQFVCWGAWDQGQILIPSGLDTPYEFNIISLGKFHSCVSYIEMFTKKIILNCFGSNKQGQSTVPTIIYQSIMHTFSSGAYHVCALYQNTSSILNCWGLNNQGQLDYNIPFDQAQVSNRLFLGEYHSCALYGILSRDRNGDQQYRQKCWGNNNYGQLGIKPRQQIGKKDIDNNEDVMSGAGVDITCWNTRGKVDCIGEQDGVIVEVPKSVRESKMVSLGVGSTHVCVIVRRKPKKEAEMFCWGNNSYGQVQGN